MNKNKLVKLCVDTATGKVENYNYTREQASDAIRTAFQQITGTDKIDYKVMRRHRNEIFEVLEEVLEQLIVEGWGEDPFFRQFVDYRNIARGDKNLFYVPDRSVLVSSKISDGNLNLQRQRLDVGDEVSVKTEPHGVKIYEEFARFTAGRIDWSEFVDKVSQAMDQEIQQNIYDSFMDSMDYLPAKFKETGSFDDKTMLDIVEHVEASSGRNAVIAGTRKALSEIVDSIEDNWISEVDKEDRRRTGKIARWNGVPLLQIPQAHKPNSDFDFLVSNSRLMVVPEVQPIKFVREGEVYIKEISDGLDNEDMTVEYTFIDRWGMAVIFNVLYGMYEVETGS